MKFNVFYSLRSRFSGVIMEVPRNDNPVEFPSLKALLDELAKGLPGSDQLGIVTVGLRVERYEEKDRIV